MPIAAPDIRSLYIHVDTNNVIVYVKTEHTYGDLEKDVEMFDT